MIPLLSSTMLVNLMTRGKPAPRTLDADYAWYMETHPVATPVVTRDAWPLRLLPQSLRAPIKARLAARQYEQTLIKLWEISPHLISDIGVTFSPVKGSQDHLVSAPAGLVAHVAARGPLPTEPQMQIRQPPNLAPSAPQAPAKVDLDHHDPQQTQVAA